MRDALSILAAFLLVGVNAFFVAIVASLLVNRYIIVHQPASLNFASQCEPSQNGLFFDSPQAQSQMGNFTCPS